jgi:hypothetical protein
VLEGSRIQFDPWIEAVIRHLCVVHSASDTCRGLPSCQRDSSARNETAAGKSHNPPSFDFPAMIAGIRIRTRPRTMPAGHYIFS